VRARASAAVAASSGLAFFDASLLIRPPRTLALLDEHEDGTLGDLGPWRARGYATLPPRALRDLVRLTTPDADVELGPGGGLWMRGRTEDLRPALGAWLGRAARSVAVDLRLLADGRLLGRARLVARSGGAAFVRVGRDQAYLRDADVEVG
jgi:hypothetical protein